MGMGTSVGYMVCRCTVMHMNVTDVLHAIKMCPGVMYVMYMCAGVLYVMWATW